LGRDVWYEVRTGINNREPLFRRGSALAIFAGVFRETGLRFRFAVCRLHLEDDWLTFYIKPADGLELPAILKWLKQVFAQRVNRAEGRIGHIWGDRYWSRIVDGEPPEDAREAAGDADSGVRLQWKGSGEGTQRSASGVRPWRRGTMAGRGFSLIFLLPIAPAPG
jgi:hypothetical protein